jgi:hypothetical protein
MEQSNETAVQTTEAAAVPAEAPVMEAQRPEDIASRLYVTLLPQFDAQLRMLSKKGMYRVLQLLIKDPLEEVHFKMTDRTELNVLAIASRLMDAKFIMISTVMAEAMAEQDAAAAEQEKQDGTELQPETISS